MSLSERFHRSRDWLSQPIAAQSLAATRILFGLILFWDYFRYVGADRIERYYVHPFVNFPYFGLDFVTPLPEPYIHWMWGVVGVSAALIALGLFYRIAIIAFILSFGYFFLLDRVQYLNHNYMVLLYAALLAFAPANRLWSLDAVLGFVRASPVIPRWPVAAIRLQTEIILIFAGTVKITDDWLRGEPLRIWLPANADSVFYGGLFQYDWIYVAAPIGVIALHILGAPLLLFRRTRLAVFLIYVCFHVSNSALFSIGIFPWITIAVTLIFFDPNWPEQLYRRLRGQPLPEAAPAASTPLTAGLKPLSSALAVFLVAWFAVQLFLPVRQVFFPNNVGWTGDGHRFSWRMRIYNRAAEGGFYALNPETEELLWFDPIQMLGQRSGNTILSHPDLAREFAIFIAERLKDNAGWENVQIYPRIKVALNGRPLQDYYNLDTDLVQAEYNVFGTDEWVLPPEHRAAEDLLPAWYPPLPLQK